MKIPKRGNQNPYIEEVHTTEWTKEIVQKDKQRSTKHTHKQLKIEKQEPHQKPGVNSQHNGQKKNTSRQTTINKTYRLN